MPSDDMSDLSSLTDTSLTSCPSVGSTETLHKATSTGRSRRSNLKTSTAGLTCRTSSNSKIVLLKPKEDNYGYVDELNQMEPIPQGTADNETRSSRCIEMGRLSKPEITLLRNSACFNCVQYSHDIRHANTSRGCFANQDPYTCKKKPCVEFFRDLIATEFHRRDDCNARSHLSLRGRNSSLTPAVREPYKNGKLGDNGSRILSNLQVNKPPHSARTTLKRKMSRASCRLSSPLQAPFIDDTAGGNATVDADKMASFAPGRSANDHKKPFQPLQDFNLQVLETYEDRIIPEKFVEHRWESIKDGIVYYNHFVHGGELQGDIGDEHRALEESKPFYEVMEIKQERVSSGRPEPQSSLMLILREIFCVGYESTVSSKVALLGRDITEMKLSTLLRGVLAYILYKEIFTVKEDYAGEQAYYLGLDRVFGVQIAAKANQYCRLLKLKSAEYKAFLHGRAMQLAKMICDDLSPLTHQVPHSAINTGDQHFCRLFEITEASLQLAATLNAYQGSWRYIREEYGAAYRWELFEVEPPQVDEVGRMSQQEKAMQRVAFTVMPAIQRTMPGDQRIMTYARGIVVLQTPYVDETMGSLM